MIYIYVYDFVYWIPTNISEYKLINMKFNKVIWILIRSNIFLTNSEQAKLSSQISFVYFCYQRWRIFYIMQDGYIWSRLRWIHLNQILKKCIHLTIHRCFTFQCIWPSLLFGAFCWICLQNWSADLSFWRFNKIIQNWVMKYNFHISHS